jgi:hypothetical protein
MKQRFKVTIRRRHLLGLAMRVNYSGRCGRRARYSRAGRRTYINSFLMEFPRAGHHHRQDQLRRDQRRASISRALLKSVPVPIV